MSQDSWGNSWPQPSNWTQEGKGKKGKSKDWGKGQHSKNSYGSSGSRDGNYNNYYGGYNAGYGSGKGYSTNWWPRHSGTPAEMPSWAATMAASAMEMAITGSMKDIAVNVASKWAKLVSNVVMKTAAGAMKSAILGDSDTAATTTADSSQKSSNNSAAKETLSEPTTGENKESDGNAVAKHLLQELKKTSHNAGKRSKRCRRLSTSSSESLPQPGPKMRARSKLTENSETELKQQALIERLLNKVQQLERDVQASDSNKQKAMLDMMLVKIKALESQRRDGDTKNQQTKIERLQEKIRELETRNHYIIERARDSIPTPKRRPKPVIEVQRVPHPDADGLTTLPSSAVLPSPQQMSAEYNNIPADATQADDDCSLLLLGMGHIDTSVTKKQNMTHNDHHVAFSNYINAECRRDLTAPMDTLDYVEYMSKKYTTAWWQERCKAKGVSCPTGKDLVKILWNDFSTQVRS